MEELNESLYEKILDFDSTRKAEWVKERKPYAVLFELTSNCNFNCVHCYLQNDHVKEVLSTKQVMNILDILCEKGILFLTLTGGEIFTRSDFCELYLYAKKKGFFVEIFTNGYMLTDEMVEIFKEYPPLLVSISLYGACDETYYRVTGVKNGFTQVLNNCRRLVDNGVRVALKSPIMSLTQPEMQQMEEAAKSIGLSVVFSFEIHNAIDGSEAPVKYRTDLKSALGYEFDDYLNRNVIRDDEKIRSNTLALQNDPHIFTCNVATNSFIVDYCGNMLPCMKLRKRGVSLLNNSFDNIWNEFKAYKELMSSPNYICKKCDSVYFCDTCPAECDMLRGDMESRTCADCKAAKIRKAFYTGEIDYDEAMRMADL